MRGLQYTNVQELQRWPCLHLLLKWILPEQWHLFPLHDAVYHLHFAEFLHCLRYFLIALLPDRLDVPGLQRNHVRMSHMWRC